MVELCQRRAGHSADVRRCVGGNGPVCPDRLRYHRLVIQAMHVHILGISGTFMGGIAAIARAAGHRVTGSDRNVYPPMSNQLEALGIDVIQGFEAGQLDVTQDVVVVGNMMTRGYPVVDALLERGLPYTSGPEWLA